MMTPNQKNEQEIRAQKRRALESSGVSLYPSTSHRTHVVSDVLSQFDELLTSGQDVTVAGRVRSLRLHGKSLFLHLEDRSGRIQCFLQQDVLGESYERWKQYLDTGDFIEIRGTIFLTKQSEKTVRAETVTWLAKALNPLPDKWSGLKDKELRYRRRYLDFLANPEAQEIAKKRSNIVRAIRQFLDQHEFMEVETPILQSIPGGATARPFVTHHYALDTDFYLRVAPELFLKRLVVGGFERVYEIARCFRNEGMDYAHNPEFTQVECYQAYQDYDGLMTLIEELLIFILDQVTFSRDILYKNEKISFHPPFRRLRFADGLLEYADLDLHREHVDWTAVAKKKGLDPDASWGRGKIFDELFKKFVRPNLIQPTFLIDHPIELSPLAKKHREHPGEVERFQLICGGEFELCNAFTELNDPWDQAQRFRDQEALRTAGDDEAQRFDQDYVDALSVGMPPTAGFGMGIDRLVSVLTNAENLKEVILFPTLKPEQSEEQTP
jgi:lysyl-tRNA synthetase class 2